MEFLFSCFVFPVNKQKEIISLEGLRFVEVALDGLLDKKSCLLSL